MFFCRAALALARVQQPAVEVVHCHDWQSALIPVYLQAGLPRFTASARPATLLTVHNLAYQGIFPAAASPSPACPIPTTTPAAWSTGAS